MASRCVYILALATSLAAGCDTPCDKTLLAEAAGVMADRSPDARQSAFEKLGKACPTLPPGLGHSLRAAYTHIPADEAATIYASRGQDPGYTEARRLACAIEREVWVEAARSNDRDAAVFEACDFKRYAVLANDETFIFNDFDAFVLYAWLTRNRNDQTLSRELVRGLMAVSASKEELMSQCLASGDGCRAAFAAAGMQLPFSSSASPIRSGLIVELTGNAVRIGEEEITTLSGGGFEHHVDGALRRAFTKHIEKSRTDGSGVPRITLLADPNTSARDVVDVLFTANKVGYIDYQLVAFSGSGLVSLQLSAPRRWLPGMDREQRGPRASAPALEVSVRMENVFTDIGDKSRLLLPHKADCTQSPGDCLDAEAIGSWLNEAKTEYPDSTAVSFRVDPQIPLQTLVDAMDLARGQECALNAGMEEVPPECHFWRATLDLRKWLRFDIDLQRTVSFGEASIELTEGNKPQHVDEKRIMQIYETKREELVKCFEDDADFNRSTDMNPNYAAMFGFAPKVLEDGSKGEAAVVVRVWTGNSDDPYAGPWLDECVANIFGFEMHTGPTTEFVESTELTLSLPVTVTVVSLVP